MYEKQKVISPTVSQVVHPKFSTDLQQETLVSTNIGKKKKKKRQESHRHLCTLKLYTRVVSKSVKVTAHNNPKSKTNY